MLNNSYAGLFYSGLFGSTFHGQYTNTLHKRLYERLFFFFFNFYTLFFSLNDLTTKTKYIVVKKTKTNWILLSAGDV